jgi:hypothetical protein
MTPEQYREKWGLPADYPMVAPNYAKARSELAKEMGLGQQRRKGRTSRGGQCIRAEGRCQGRCSARNGDVTIPTVGNRSNEGLGRP